MTACRQVGTAGGYLPLNCVLKRTGGDRMSDYEIIIVILTIIGLLIAVDSKNKG